VAHFTPSGNLIGAALRSARDIRILQSFNQGFEFVDGALATNG